MAIISEALEEINQIVEHLLSHKDFGRKVMSRSYPFSLAELRKYTKILEWVCVSMNNKISWTEQLFNEFENKIDIAALRDNESFPWTEEFIDKHFMDLFYEIEAEVGIRKSVFSLNPGLPWTEEFIEKYAEHWDWEYLSVNYFIPFSIDLLKRYEDKWNFDSLELNSRIISDQILKDYLNVFYNKNVQEYFHSCPFCYKGEEVFEEYKGKSVPPDFFNCPHFNWTPDFGSKLRSRLRGIGDEKIVVKNIMAKPFNHWSIDILDAFEEFWDYKTLHTPVALTDYLAFAVKKNGRLEEVMAKI